MKGGFYLDNHIYHQISDLDDANETVGITDADFCINANTLRKYTGNKMDVIVPNGITNINTWAFHKYQKKLKSIQFPSSLERISECAFAGFTKLKEIYLPKNVKYNPLSHF